MPYSIELPDGTLIADVPDEVDPDTAVTNVGRSDPKVAKFAPQTKLGSWEGAKAIGVAEAQGVAQAGLGMVGGDIEMGTVPPETSVPLFEMMQRGLGIRQPSIDVMAGAEPTPAEKTLLESRRKLSEAANQLLPVNPSEPLRHGMGVGQSLGLNLPGFLASMATGNVAPALIGAGASTKWMGQEQAREAGVPAEAANVSGALQAIPEVALEFWPVGRFLKEVGVDPLLKAAAKFVGREEVTELGTTASQELIKWATEHPDMPVGQFLSTAGQALIDTAIQTPFSAGLMAGTGALIAPVTGGNTRAEPPSPPTTTPPTQPYQPGIPALLQPPAPVQPTEGLTKEEAGPEPQLSTGPVEPDLEAGQAILDSIGMETELPSTPPPAAVLPQNVELAADLDAVNEFMDVGEVPQSHRSMMNAENYTTPNDEIPRSQRTILVGPKGIVGKRFGEVDWSTQPKTTIILGEPSVDRPLPYLKAVRGVYEALRSTFTPDAGLVISNETIQNRTGAGWHYRMQGGNHLIVPTPLRRVGEVEVKKFNPVTLARSFFNIFHEFGHMLAEARFLEKLDPATRDEFLNVMGSGPIPARLILALEQADPAAGSVVRDWQSRIARILDGSMTAEEFRREWWGPAKVRHSTLLKDLGVAPNAPAKDLIAAIAMRTVTGDRTGAMDSMQVADARSQQMRRYTSFHEFFAEQLARHAEAKGASSASPFFQGALNSLRLYFRKLKQGIFDAEGTEYKIEAGTSFQEWIEGMGGMAKALEKIAKSGGKVARVTKGARAKAPTPKTAPAKPQGPPKGLTPVQETLLGLMDIHPSGPTVDKARELVLLGRVQEAQDLLADAMEGRIQWELDEEAVAEPAVEPELEDILLDDKIEIPRKLQKYILEELAKGPERAITPTGSGWVLPDGRVKAVSGMHILHAADILAKISGLHQKNIVGYGPAVTGLVIDSGPVRWAGDTFEFGQQPLTPAQITTIQGMFPIIGGHGLYLGAVGDRSTLYVNPSEEAALPAKLRQIQRRSTLYRAPRVQYDLDIDSLLERGLTEAEAKDPKLRTVAAKEWYAEGTKSRFFKAWFGDWERNPDEASKVRTAEGQPLITFHVTASMHEVFDRGDIGFHFGTQGASANRYKDLSGVTEYGERQLDVSRPWHSLPVFLNLRNPLDVGPETADMWFSPVEMGVAAYTKGVISREELDTVLAEDMGWEQQHGDEFDPKSLYQRFGYLRGLLASKGFDGIKYHNRVEGGTSWVAFYPDQVKSATGRNHTFSRSRSMQWDTDFDLSTEEGAQSAGLLRRLQKFGLNNSWLRGYLRWQMKFATDAVEGQQIAALHPDVLPLQNMQINGDKYIQRRSGLFLGPVDMLNWLRWKGKENAARMWKTILREVAGGKHTLTTITGVAGRWEQQPTPKLREELLASGIRPEQVDEVALRVLQIKQSWLDIFNYAAKVMSGRYAAKLIGIKSPAEIKALVKANVEDVLAVYVNTPFFPETSFGDVAVVLEQKNSKGQWRPIFRRFFESERQMEKELVTINGRIKGNENLRVVPVTKIEKRIGVLVNLPKEFVDEVAEQLDLTVSERNQLEQLMHPSKMDRVTQMFGKRVLGGTNDYARNYADFVWHTVNSLAKMEYAGKFTRNIRDMRRMVEAAREIEDPLVRIMEERRLSTIENWMHRTKEYILNPPNEHQRLRTGIALTYLWLMPKTALMNFFGLMTTATHLSAKYNPIVGSKRFMQAMDEALTSASPFEGGKGNNPEIDALIERATKDGLITESYAYHIAAVATEGTLGRLPGQSVMELFKERGIDAGLFLFRTAEHATRRVALIAAWHEGRDEGMNPDEAYQYAYRQTKLQQNSFNPFDRPVWMRGEVVAPATVFYGFTQHMMFHAFGGYELGMRRKSRQQDRTPRSIWGGYTMQLWGMILLLAGYEGLPMAEDWLNLLDPLFRRTFGKSARQYMRENMKWFEELTGLDSAILAHGLAHDVAGVSVSRSIGLGKMVPGSDFFKEGATAMESFGNLALGMLGPLGGILGWGVKAALGDRDALGKLSSFPGAVGAWSTALSWGLNGAKDPDGASLITDEKGRPVDPSAGQIIMRGLGFQSTEIANTRERRFAQQEGKEYWSERRSRLLRDRATAQVERDREAIADTTTAIREFNAELPPGWRAMAIRPEQIRQSIKSRLDEIRARETEVPRQKSYRGLYREIGEAYK